MHKITIIVGSLRKESINRQLAGGIVDLGKDLFSFEFAEIGSLPLFSEDLEKAYPPAAQALKDSIRRADGILIVTPEYNRGIPGVLKHALDWASRPSGQNALTGKCAASIGASSGAIGTAACQAQMRSLLTVLNTVLMVQPEVYLQYTPDIFDGGGRIVDERCKNHLRHFLSTFSAWVGKHK